MIPSAAVPAFRQPAPSTPPAPSAVPRSQPVVFQIAKVSLSEPRARRPHRSRTMSRRAQPSASPQSRPTDLARRLSATAGERCRLSSLPAGCPRRPPPALPKPISRPASLNQFIERRSSMVRLLHLFHAPITRRFRETPGSGSSVACCQRDSLIQCAARLPCLPVSSSGSSKACRRWLRRHPRFSRLAGWSRHLSQPVWQYRSLSHVLVVGEKIQFTRCALLCRSTSRA